MPLEVRSSGVCGPKYLYRSSLPKRQPTTRGFVERPAAAVVVAPAPAPAAAAPGVMRGGRRGALKRQKTRAQLSERLEQMQLSLPTATPGFGEEAPRASVPRVPR